MHMRYMEKVRVIKKILAVVVVMTIFTNRYDTFGSNQNDENPANIQKPTVILPMVETYGNDVTRTLDPRFENGLPRDIYKSIFQIASRNTNPLHIALSCKSFYKYIFDHDFVKREGDDISEIPYYKLSPHTQSCFNNWWVNLDLRILDSGIFRFKPEKRDAIEVKLSKAGAPKEDLNLPEEVKKWSLCITRKIEKFTSPDEENKGYNIALLLTLGELKCVARKISDDTIFIEHIDLENLSKGAVCILMKYSRDDLKEWGFRYNIMKFKTMNGWPASVFESVGHYLCRLVGEGGRQSGVVLGEYSSFFFELH